MFVFKREVVFKREADDCFFKESSIFKPVQIYSFLSIIIDDHTQSFLTNDFCVKLMREILREFAQKLYAGIEARPIFDGLACIRPLKK